MLFVVIFLNPQGHLTLVLQILKHIYIVENKQEKESNPIKAEKNKRPNLKKACQS